MIEKIFEQSTCVSCGAETPVIFLVNDFYGNPMYRIPLCRECSDVFAKDRIDILKRKLEKKAESKKELVKEVKVLKTKVKQMNIKSSNHKRTITNLMSRTAKESR